MTVAVYVVFWSGSKAPQNVVNNQTDQNVQATLPTSSVVPVTDSAPVANKTFTVTGQNFSFSPAQIKVKKGEVIKIVFKNAAGFHDFMIDKYNVRAQRIQGGSEEVITFTADKTGSFEYYCSVGTHRAQGMKGTLIVE